MLKKLAEGEYSLRLTFWVFGMLGFFVFAVLTGMTRAGVLHHIGCSGSYCPRNLVLFILPRIFSLMTSGAQSGVMPYILAHLLMSAVFGVYAYLVLRGLWKAAKSYTGPKFWSLSAETALVALAFVCLRAVF